MSKTIAGALVGNALGAFGKKPKIPELPMLDTGVIQGKSILDNIAAIPDLSRLASSVNQFTFSEVSKMLEAVLPGFTGALQKASQTTAAFGRGEIPDDVSRAVQSSAAAKAAAGGFSGSGFGRNLTARDLGLTSLNLIGEGFERMTKLGGFAAQTFPTFDISSAFVTPQQKLAFDYQQNLDQWQRALLKAQVKAAPDPYKAQLGEAFDNFFETWKNVGMGALGGMGGGAGGGAGGMSGMMGMGKG